MHRDHLGRRLGLERQPAQQQVVRDHAERVDIGLRRHRPAASLFGREVRGRADQLAIDRVMHGVLEHARNAPVEDLDPRRPRVGRLDHEDVIELEIAMYDPGGMRGAQRIADLEQHVDRLARRDRPLGSRTERLAVQPLHHDVRPAIRQRADVENIDDAGVLDRVDHARLEQHPLGVDALPEQAAMQDLERRALADLGVNDRIYRPHPAPAEQVLDPPRTGHLAMAECLGVCPIRLSSLGADQSLHV